MKSTAPPAKPRRRYVQGVRAQAAEDTARRIVKAFYDRLMAQWFDEITLDRVAADAGVTVQTVVRRFGGKEQLLEEAIKVLCVQAMARRAAPAGGLETVIRGLVADYDASGDAVLRLLALEQRHPALAPYLNTGRRYHREWIESVLKKDLGQLDGHERARAIDALVVATDLYTWKLLRRDMSRSVTATTATMARLVRATLAEFAGHDTGDRK